MAEAKHQQGPVGPDIPSFDTPTKHAHFSCEIEVPPDLPVTWLKPQSYILSAVNNKFGDNASFLHAAPVPPRSILFITSEEDLCGQIRSLAAGIVRKMTHTFVFRLRVERRQSLER